MDPCAQTVCRSTLRAALLFAISFVLLARSEAAAGNCPNTNPNDTINDSSALQWCLDNLNTVILDPGSPGYVVNNKLWLRRNNQTITSSRKPAAATLIAGRDLFAHMLQTEGPQVRLRDRVHQFQRPCALSDGQRDPLAPQA
jgi:hypothetical protein